MSALPRQRDLLSQNFLRDPHLVATLLDRFDLGSESVVYEIGPGKGVITEQLAQRFRRVVAIEKDTRLAHLLQRRFSDRPNVTIHAGDFLSYPLPRTPYKVFANIPFNITSAIVARLTQAERPPDAAYLVMQHEAARMFLGKPRESLRAVLLQPWFEIEIVHRFERGDFVPVPRVDVVMLRLRKRGPPLVSRVDQHYFRDFIVYVYTHWQPNAVSPLNHLFTREQRRFIARELELDIEARPTALSIQQWLALFGELKRVGDPRTHELVVGSERRLLQQQSRLQKSHRTRRAGRKV